MSTGDTGGDIYEDMLYFKSYKSPQLVSVTSTVVGVERESWDGETTPNFKKRKAKGEFLGYTNWVNTREFGHWHSEWDFVFTTSPLKKDWSVGGCLFQFPRLNSDTLAPYVDELWDTECGKFVTEAAASCYSRGADVLTILAEIHKIGPMLTSLARRLKAFRDTYGIMFQKNAGIAEAHFGWANIIRDIQDITRAVNEIGEAENEIVTARRGSSVIETKSGSILAGSSTGKYTAYWDYVDTFDFSYRGAVAAKFSPARFRMNPITTAWELIPFSWAVDWVLSVGSWLESLSLMLLTQDYTAARGYKLRAQRSASLRVEYVAPYSGSASGSGMHSIAQTVRRRTTVPRYPSLYLKLDAFKFSVLIDILQGAKRVNRK